MIIPITTTRLETMMRQANATNGADKTTIAIILSIVLLAVLIMVWRVFWYRRYRQAERRQRQDALLLAQARRAAARRATEDNDEEAQQLAEQALEKFHSAPVQTDSLCAVCLEVLDVAEGNVLAAPCMHVLHEKCWKGWLAKDPKRACPICRRSVIIEADDDANQEKDAHGVDEQDATLDDNGIQGPEPAVISATNSSGRARRRLQQSRHLSLLSNLNQGRYHRRRNNRGRDRGVVNDVDDETSHLEYDHEQSRHLSLILFDSEDLEDISLSNGIISLTRVTEGPSSNSLGDVARRRDRIITASANINLLGTLDACNNNNNEGNDNNDDDHNSNSHNNESSEQQRQELNP